MEPGKKLWYTRKECCAHLSMDDRLFRHYVAVGIFPKGFRRGKRSLVWHADDLAAMEYLEKNRHRFRRRKPESTPEPSS